MRIEALAVGLTISWAAIGGAGATEVQFTVTGGDSATFELPLNPMPNVELALALFEVFSVPAVIEGTSTTLADLTFFAGGIEGGGGFAGDNVLSFSGPQLYKGPESRPTFVPGTYTVIAFGGETDTLTIAPIISNPSGPPNPPPLSVPEPSTWAMLLLGFVGLSYAGYRKVRTRTAFARRRG